MMRDKTQHKNTQRSLDASQSFVMIRGQMTSKKDVVMVRKFVKEDGKNWDKWLEPQLFAVREVQFRR